MAADHALRRELSRRIRDDLIRLGIVAPGARGAHRRRHHGQRRGPDHLHPQRPHGPGGRARPHAGQRRPAPHRRRSPAGPDRPPGPGRRPAPPGSGGGPTGTFLYATFQRCRAGLRGHRPCRPGPHRDRRAGRDRRHRGPPARLRRADPRHRHQHGLRIHRVPEARRPGAGPAPGAGTGPLRPAHRRTHARARPPQRPQTGDALAVLSGVLDRDGQQLSASQTRQQALANADHLAILHAIWTDQTTPAREQHYRDLLAAHLPPEHRREPGHQARWLWRTLRAAELAGLDPGEVLAAAIGERDLTGARDSPPSSTPGSGTGSAPSSRPRLARGRPSSPPFADPERRAYITEIAALMDARKDRIGEHAAEHAPPWAVTALGPVPDDPLDRLDWQRRAASIGAWRELSGYAVTPPTRSAPSPSRPPRTCAPPGTRPWPPSAPPTGPTCAACPTGGCCTCATPTRSKPPGRRNTSATSSARSAPPPDARLAGLRAAAEADAAQQSRRPRHRRPPAGARGQLPRPARRLPAARGPSSPPPWPTAPTGSRHPRPAPPGRRRRRRTPPPPPRPALPAAPLRRTRARHRQPARRAHPDPGAASRAR